MPLALLKHNRFVQFAALDAARAVHVRVIGIDVTASLAAKNPVLRVRRAEAAAAHFGIDPHNAQRAEQQGHINHNQRGNAHVTVMRRARSSRVAARCAS